MEWGYTDRMVFKNILRCNCWDDGAVVADDGGAGASGASGEGIIDFYSKF
jgi:hypothetical protein